MLKRFQRTYMLNKQKILGKLIKDRRKELRLSQASIAKQLGFGNGQLIYNVENGRCGIPVKSMARLSIILQLPLETLKQAAIQDFTENLTQEINKSL